MGLLHTTFQVLWHLENRSAWGANRVDKMAMVGK